MTAEIINKANKVLSLKVEKQSHIYIHCKKKTLGAQEEEGDIMSRNINNSALSSESRRTGARASGYHIPTERNSFEVPAFPRSHSTRTTSPQMTPSPLNPLWYMADRRQAGLYSIPESDSHELPVFYQASSRHATPVQTTPSPQNPPWYRADRRHSGLYSTPDDSYEVPVLFRSSSRQVTPYFQDERTSNVMNHPRFLEDSFSAQPHMLNGDTGMGFNPRLRETHRPSIPPRRSVRQSDAQPATAIENPRSRALSKLKKEIYEPNIPTSKMLAKKLSFYYRESKGVNSLKEMENKEKNEDGKSCAVCLEDFVPKQEVMVTPCKHMFHEDCIMPWLRSQGQCPICRFVILEKERENPLPLNDDEIGTSYVIAGELMSIVRAMEEAIRLGPETH